MDVSILALFVFLLIFIIIAGYLLVRLEELERSVKAGQLIILGNSSYKCKQINTLEEK